MKYTFPHIKVIEDILPHIKDKEEFIVIKKELYTIIDYILQSNETFPKVLDNGPVDDPLETYDLTAAIRRECRGLVFDLQGKLISRPFHKFFNYGEKPDEQHDLGQPSHVLQKLDGSMIRPLILHNNIRLATRKGITDVAMQAEVFAAPKINYMEAMLQQIKEDRTPIFEWCSRRNQIVLEYPEDDLVLLAIRDNHTGHYLSHEYVQSVGKEHNISVVPEFIIPEVNHIKLTDYVDYAKQLKDAEGCVIVFPNGHKLKAKGEWYTTLHKAKDMIGREKDMIKIFLQGGIDDLLPLFSEKDQKEINAFLDKITNNLLVTAKRLNKIFQDIKSSIPSEYTRKDFALQVLKQEPKYKSFLFSLLAGDLSLELLTEELIKACSTNKTLDEHRWIIGGIKFKEAKPDVE